MPDTVNIPMSNQHRVMIKVQINLTSLRLVSFVHSISLDFQVIKLLGLYASEGFL